MPIFHPTLVAALKKRKKHPKAQPSARPAPPSGTHHKKKPEKK